MVVPWRHSFPPGASAAGAGSGAGGPTATAGSCQLQCSAGETSSSRTPLSPEPEGAICFVLSLSQSGTILCTSSGPSLIPVRPDVL